MANRTLGGQSKAYIGPVEMAAPDGDDSMEERYLRERQGAVDKALEATIDHAEGRIDKERHDDILLNSHFVIESAKRRSQG